MMGLKLPLMRPFKTPRVWVAWEFALPTRHLELPNHKPELIIRVLRASSTLAQFRE